MTSRETRRDGLCGFLLIDKPAGPTSHDVVGWVRWALRERRVGHCGTLDPAATGLLLVCVGAATRLSDSCAGQDKIYRAEFLLGRGTVTADLDGEILEQRACSSEDGERARSVVLDWAGVHQLPPPRYSAIHVEGRRAHELARHGTSFEIPAREMVVRSVDDVVVREGALGIFVSVTLCVSKGTYIRSLAVALGEAIGTPVTLASLRRLGSGSLSVQDPRLVSGIEAVALPPAEGGSGTRGRSPDSGGRTDQKPRFRLRCAGVADDRDSQGARLQAALIAPVEALTLPIVQLADTAAGMRALLRLSSGQAVVIGGDITVPPLPGREERSVAVVGGGALILAEQRARVAGGESIHDEAEILSSPASPPREENTTLLHPRRVVVPARADLLRSFTAACPQGDARVPSLDNRAVGDDSPPD